MSICTCSKGRNSPAHGAISIYFQFLVSLHTGQLRSCPIIRTISALSALAEMFQPLVENLPIAIADYIDYYNNRRIQAKTNASRKIPGSIHDAKLIVQFYRRCPDNWVHITLEALFAGHVPSSGWTECRYFIFAR